jgi:hypothetical protein
MSPAYKTINFNVTGPNYPPTVPSIATPSGTQNGNVTITYSLADAESDACGIQAQYSLDGGTTWTAATQASGGDGTAGLASSPAGTAHAFVWNSTADLGSSNNSAVKIRITPTDADGTGTPATTDAFAVDDLYSVQIVTDPQTSNIEYQMWEGGFHFGTLLQTPQGTIGFRGHPDQNDVNGWGATVQENVYIAGTGVDATGGQVTSAVPESDGVRVSAGGTVPSAAGNAGTWTWTSVISYDPTAQKVVLTGSTTVSLTASLAGDMNIGRDDSNYLYDYALNGGGVGPTGDMKSVSFTYGPDSSVRENQWTPLPGLESTSPQDASDDVTTTVWGQINRSDPNQAAIAKPTVQRELVSNDPATKLIVACGWDSAKADFGSDNVGVEQIVRQQNTAATNFAFQNKETWTLPDTTDPIVTADALTATTSTPVLTGTASTSSSAEASIAQVMVVVKGDQTSRTLAATVNGTTWSAAVSTALPDGTYDVQATATDKSGNTAFATATLTVNTAPNQPPSIGSLSVSPDPVTEGSNITLTANNVTDSDGTVAKVEFYRDTNGNGAIDAGTDTLLGTATSSGSGWKCTASTSGFPVGNITYLARAQDDDGAWSNTVATKGMTAATDTAGGYDATTSRFFFTDSNTTGISTINLLYGVPGIGLVPLSGDWNGDGTDTVGLYDPTHSAFYLRNSNDSGMADTVFWYGPPGGGLTPVVGDWDGNGTDTVGLYDRANSVFYLRNSNTTGVADTKFAYEPAQTAGLTPVAGDWGGKGTDTVGLYDGTTSVFYLRSSNTTGPADIPAFTFGVGNTGEKPLVGDWNGTAGKDTAGLYDPATSILYLRCSNSGGNADIPTFVYGPANTSTWTPLAGHWSGSEQHLMAADQGTASVAWPTLTPADLQPIVREAVARWADAGLNAAAVARLGQVQVVVADLPGCQLGDAAGNRIYLDVDAAGHAWFVDPTLASDEEFASPSGSPALQAIDRRAVDKIDLLTVVEHELGHVAGLSDADPLTSDVMNGILGVGVRRNASRADAALVSM